MSALCSDVKKHLIFKYSLFPMFSVSSPPTPYCFQYSLVSSNVSGRHRKNKSENSCSLMKMGKGCPRPKKHFSLCYLSKGLELLTTFFTNTYFSLEGHRRSGTALQMSFAIYFKNESSIISAPCLLIIFTYLINTCALTEHILVPQLYLLSSRKQESFSVYLNGYTTGM